MSAGLHPWAQTPEHKSRSSSTLTQTHSASNVHNPTTPAFTAGASQNPLQYPAPLLPHLELPRLMCSYPFLARPRRSRSRSPCLAISRRWWEIKSRFPLPTRLAVRMVWRGLPDEGWRGRFVGCHSFCHSWHERGWVRIGFGL